MDTIEKLMPAVSILMLTYNRARYLPEAIQSVLDQSYTDWELVIIDDGSTDDTPAIVARFPDPRIRYIRYDENQGLFPRRRESLQYARGTYTAILDSDDYWLSPEKLAKQVAFLESHPDHVLVGSFTQLVGADGEAIGLDTFATSDADIRNRILLRNQFTHSGVLMRTNALKKTEGYQPLFAEDLELFLQLGIHGKFASIPEPLVAHRIHRGSANDRGVLMATAVLTIIRHHGHNYPRRLLALATSLLRIAKAHVKRLIAF